MCEQVGGGKVICVRQKREKTKPLTNERKTEMGQIDKAFDWLLDKLREAEENGQEEFELYEIQDFMDEVKEELKEYGY